MTGGQLRLKIAFVVTCFFFFVVCVCVWTIIFQTALFVFFFIGASSAFAFLALSFVLFTRMANHPTLALFVYVCPPFSVPFFFVITKSDSPVYI